MGFILRILFIAALIYFVIRLVKQTRQQTTNTATQQDGPIPMTKCAECQVLFPKAEAISKGQQSFCSTEHLHKWLEKQ
ncbi:MAG TPA: PP0621 family protein [Alcanivoracaceae bacterium]|nr:PP0621 family protein [Alcanivoracaceae bacterium]